MKIEYQTRRFTKSSKIIIDQAEDILDEWGEQGFTLTLRQLYYRFVALGLLENIDSNYKRLGSIINDARLAGLIDWDQMTDRTRTPSIPSTWDGPGELLEACAQQYEIDRWADQPRRVEVWVEKDALVEIVSQACVPLQTPYFSCRGYTSQSAMWQAAQRINGYVTDGHEPVIIHLGDHDPSGIDMTRDIIDRMEMFWDGVGDLVVNRIALNMDQIREFNPPPNPTKMTDSRAQGYVEEFGRSCWELDALEPTEMVSLIREEISSYLNHKKWAAALRREKKDLKQLKKFAKESSK